MAFAAVQTSTQATGTGTTVVITTSATVASNLVVVHIVLLNTTETCSSVTDDKGNTYVLSSAIDEVGQFRMYQAYGVQITGGTTAITVTFSSNVVSKRCGADEFSGGSSTNATIFDVSTTGTGAASPTAVSTLTPRRTGSLIVATLVADNVADWTAGTNYTLSNGVNNTQLRGQYRLSSGASETAPSSYSVGGITGWGERATSFLEPIAVTISDTVSDSDSILGTVPNQIVQETATTTESSKAIYGFQNATKNSSTFTNQTKN
jgi:hypothetical protein